MRQKYGRKWGIVGERSLKGAMYHTCVLWAEKTLRFQFYVYNPEQVPCPLPQGWCLTRGEGSTQAVQRTLVASLSLAMWTDLIHLDPPSP